MYLTNKNYIHTTTLRSRVTKQNSCFEANNQKLASKQELYLLSKITKINFKSSQTVKFPLSSFKLKNGDLRQETHPTVVAQEAQPYVHV